jgi:hypothetical protein
MIVFSQLIFLSPLCLVDSESSFKYHYSRIITDTTSVILPDNEELNIVQASE